MKIHSELPYKSISKLVAVLGFYFYFRFELWEHEHFTGYKLQFDLSYHPIFYGRNNIRYMVDFRISRECK